MIATSKSLLSPSRRHLVELMQRINFGRIEGLTVRDREPVFETEVPPRVIQDVKFGGENGPRYEAQTADFALKLQVVELFGHFDRLVNARIESLTVKHGLPFTMQIETTA